MILEARTPRSTCGRGRADPPEAPGQGLSQAPTDSGGASACGGARPAFTWRSPCLHIGLCIQISPFQKATSHIGLGFRHTLVWPPLIPIKPIPSAMTLFQIRLLSEVLEVKIATYESGDGETI